MATRCAHCGVKIEYGELRYNVTVHVAADTDGALPSGGAQEDLEAFMRSIDREETEEVGKDLQQSRALVLCPGCKNEFMDNINTPCVREEGPGSGGPGADGNDEGDGEGRVH